jgi:hypothetical protein
MEFRSALTISKLQMQVEWSNVPEPSLQLLGAAPSEITTAQMVQCRTPATLGAKSDGSATFASPMRARLATRTGDTLGLLLQ